MGTYSYSCDVIDLDHLVVHSITSVGVFTSEVMLATTDGIKVRCTIPILDRSHRTTELEHGRMTSASLTISHHPSLARGKLLEVFSCDPNDRP